MVEPLQPTNSTSNRLRFVVRNCEALTFTKLMFRSWSAPAASGEPRSRRRILGVAAFAGTMNCSPSIRVENKRTKIR